MDELCMYFLMRCLSESSYNEITFHDNSEAPNMLKVLTPICRIVVFGITKHGSALYIGMAKVLLVIDVLGYDEQNPSFSSPSDSTPITQKGSHIST